MSKGYIYILINPSLQKNFLKIGRTTRTPDLRAEELSEGTGMPSEYVVVYERWVSNCEMVEALIHDKLKNCRITSIRPDRNREFFRLPVKEAIKIVDEIIEKVELEAPSLSDMFVVIIFAVEDFDVLQEKLGYDSTNSLIRLIIEHADKYFRSFGGFTSREWGNEISTIISSCNSDDGQNILNNFAEHFQKKILPDIMSNIEIGKSDEMLTVNILAGLAQGKPQIEIESVKEFARFNWKPLASFTL